MNRNLTISAIVAGIFLAASALTFQIVSASSGSEDVFKSWRSLIPSLLDLQHRVLELEEKTEVLEERVLELEEELNENTPPLIGNFFLVEGQEYGPGDEVFIQGFLQEVVAGKDTVHIEVKAFDGTAIESEDVDLDGNNFEFFFELPYLLNDGLYTVKLEYDSWTAFSYFIVDKQQDSITVQTEDMTYDLGDDK